MSEEHHKYQFKIEQKPEGGYILRSEHPPLLIEGETKEEVEDKLKAEFTKLLPEGIANKLLELSRMAGVSVKTNITFKTNGSTQLPPADVSPSAMIASGPKAEPLISPKLVVGLLVLLGIALVVARMMRLF